MHDRLTAALADRYRIERELGAGGMATVYLAEDLKHRRRVALKVLRPELAAVLGADRFVQEITTTAALQHPHILPLFDSGTADGFLFYVMPFIDGETLRAKLDRETQLGVDEAIRIASDVADALHYAHSNGVIHRDIKPENILLANGRPMVADFGIALAVSAAAGGRMTETGLSLGTPHYMSPEQATAEKEIGARSDVYSLASVLYEMLAGQPPHTGGSAQQIIMKIITEQPADLTSLRKSVPAHVAAAVAQALEKLPSDRFASAKAFAEALANPAFSRASSLPSAAMPASTMARLRALAPWVIAVAAVAALAVSGTRVAPPPSPARVSMSVSELTAGGSAIISGSIDISRDGTTLVLVGTSAGERRLIVRRFDRFTGDVLPGTEGAVDPFFSPDGKWIGFFQGGRLRKVPSAGGSVETIRDGVTGSRGATWAEDGDVIYQPGTVGGLLRTRADGSGSVERLTTANNETAAAGCVHRFPRALPGGRYIAFTAMPCGNPGEGHLTVLDRATGVLRTLVQYATSARYLASGHLSYVTADGVLTVVPFDLGRGEITGGPVASIAGIEVDGVGNAGTYAVADNGTLAYFRGGSNVMLRVDRTGAETVLADSLPGPIAPRLSPRGDRIAFETRARGRTGIDLFDVAMATTTPLVFNRIAHYPAWSADGRRVLFSGSELQPGPGGLDLFEVDAEGATEPRVLVADPMELWEVLETPSRDRLIYRQTTRDSTGTLMDRDILHVSAGDSLKVAFATRPAQERAIALSPDGRWLAFASDESGQDEVYVRSFPDAAHTWKVSTGGGGEPAWSADGRELFYRDGRDFVSLRVEAQPTFRVVNRTALFADAYLTNVDHTNFDVHPTGSWFVVIGNGRSEQVSVVFNWFTELEARTAR